MVVALESPESDEEEDDEEEEGPNYFHQQAALGVGAGQMAYNLGFSFGQNAIICATLTNRI